MDGKGATKPIASCSVLFPGANVPAAEPLRALEDENARLRQQVAVLEELLRQKGGVPEREYEFSLLKEVSTAIVSELDLDRVLRLVADHARVLIHAETLLIPMLSEDRQTYNYAAASGKNADATRGVTLPVATGMCGWVLQHERALLFGQPDEWWMPDKPAWEEGMHSALLVPLMGRNGIIGGISGIGKLGNSSFVVRDLELLTLFANQVSIAIENAKLFTQVSELVKDLEHKVAERTADLVAVNHELEAFSYSVSHDLRAPLRSIDGFSLALIEDCRGQMNDEGRHYLERVRANCQRMGEIIDDLLRLSRLSRMPLRLAPVNLGQIARESLLVLTETSLDRKVAVTIEDGLVATADPKLIRTVMDNLIGNAWKYTSKTEAAIHLGALNVDGTRVFYVHDNGAGFDMRYADKLFGTFQRLHGDKEFPGTGIGLAIVERVMRRHHGRIWANAGVGQGATFFFCFDAVTADVEAKALQQLPQSLRER